MSAIWGIIDLDCKKVDKKVSEPFRRVYSQCKIDRTEEFMEDNIYLGCGIQYFTKEAQDEQMPIVDRENGIFFVADCILDNREEITNKLNLEKNLPDGTIMYEAYKAWGEDCSKEFLGPYAFGVYDKKEEKVIVAANHAFSRSIFYTYYDNKVYFSTLQQPLYLLDEFPHPYNDRWILDCITMTSPSMITEPEETLFENIYKVPAACFIRFTKNQKEKIRFWNIENCKEWKATDEEYEKAILDVCEQAAKSAMRTDGNIGIMLSSGLDSSSVAGLCASILRESGEKLYSFTSVPEHDYEYDKNGFYVPDETQGVMLVCRDNDNIEPEFLDCKGMNAIEDIDYLLDIYDTPTKSKQNAIWISKICERACEKNCRMVLDGQLGNVTVSAGNMIDYLYILLSHARFCKAYQELNLFCKKNRFRRKWIFRLLLSSIWETLTVPIIKYKSDIYKNAFTDKKKAKDFGVTKRFRKALNNIPCTVLQNEKKYRKNILMEVAFAQIGEMKTANGLKNGVMIRDIYKDKRVMELCYRFPIKVFVSEGCERKIIRKYLKRYVPDELCTDMRHKGLQSADYLYRIKKCWDIRKDEIKNTILNSKVRNYIDIQKFEKEFAAMTSDNLDAGNMLADQVLVLYIMAVYLDRIEKSNNSVRKLVDKR